MPWLCRSNWFIFCYHFIFVIWISMHKHEIMDIKLYLAFYILSHATFSFFKGQTMKTTWWILYFLSITVCSLPWEYTNFGNSKNCSACNNTVEFCMNWETVVCLMNSKITLMFSRKRDSVVEDMGNFRWFLYFALNSKNSLKLGFVCIMAFSFSVHKIRKMMCCICLSV